MKPFPEELWRLGPLVVTDVALMSLALTLALVIGLRLAISFESVRDRIEIVYDALESSVRETIRADLGPLVPLVLTQWLFIGVANLVGLLPGLQSPTRDLSLTAALALVSFFAGHVHAVRTRGFSYLKQYLEPMPLFLPFNVIGELSRTIALALRLFGNMLSATLVGAIFVYLAGPLVPVPLMLLSVLTAVVQAYIFGVLTLVFAASSLETAERERKPKPGGKGK